MLKILSSSSLIKLQEVADKLDIEQLGSLSIANGQYFLAVLVKEPKVTKVTKVIPKEILEEAKVEKPKPKPKTTTSKKTTTKRKPKNENTTSTN